MDHDDTLQLTHYQYLRRAQRPAHDAVSAPLLQPRSMRTCLHHSQPLACISSRSRPAALARAPTLHALTNAAARPGRRGCGARRWPSQGVPKSTEALRTLMYCLQECHDDPAADVKGRYVSPPIVHCELGRAAHPYAGCACQVRNCGVMRIQKHWWHAGTTPGRLWACHC